MNTACTLCRHALDRCAVLNGCDVYEGTVPAAVVAKRRAKNSGALKAKRLTKDETKKGGKELYTLASLESWLEGLADA